MERRTQVIYQEHRPVLMLRSAVLRVVSGPDENKSCSLDARRVRVGSAPENDLCLTDPKVSRHHLEFQVQDAGYLVLDLGSTNGTFYRGARVREAMIGPGAEVRLGSTVLRLDRGPERSEVIRARQAFGGLIGTSPAMQEVYGVLAAVAPTDTTVLIEGKTGTGKELIAEEIHRQSPRRDRLFSVMDCGAMPATLIESELFGHERGAFTGALATREGIFERSRGGTVFLDELGELPIELQTRLLRVLDRRTINRVGGDGPRKVDVRLVGATNRNLAAEVKAGRFRQDLYYRLSVVCIKLPPLRERTGDIPLLARHFLWQAGCGDVDMILTPELLRALTQRTWPGNVRELRNVVERAVIFADGALPAEAQALCESQAGDRSILRPEQVSVPQQGPAPVRSLAVGPEPLDEGWLKSSLPPAALEQPYKQLKEQLVTQLEVLYLENLCQRHGNNISRIALDAEIDRHLVRKLLRKHGLLESDG